MEWHKDNLIEDLGLAQQNQRPYKKKFLHIDKGEIDPKSFGGIAVLSTGEFDDHGFLKNLNVRYWIIYPDGRYECQNVFEITTHRGGRHNLCLDSITVLGRSIRITDSKAVYNMVEAIRRIHVNLRDREPDVPDLARIFADCRIEDIVGEKLPLPGFRLESRIHFSISPAFCLASSGQDVSDIVLPLEAIRPLMGIRKNTIDQDHSYMATSRLRVRSTPSPEIGRRFEISSELKKRKHKKHGVNMRHLMIMKREMDVPEQSIHRLVDASWHVIKARGTARFIDFRLMSQNILRTDFRAVMGAMGVVNRTHADMLKLRNYPYMLDHLAMYGHLESVSSSSLPPSPDGRLVLTSMGGNNLREIYPGIGEDIGGNCKVLETQWYDKKTRSIRKVGVIFDLGAYIIKNPGPWTGGGPDIVEKLKYCNHIFISHHHLDHLDFVIPYIKRGLITPLHTLHFTPEVYEMLKLKLQKWRIRHDDPRMPQINLLKGSGVYDVKDEEGIIRMSVLYGVDAVPHSARDTPYTAYGRCGLRVLGSYLYPGDQRFDKDWFSEHPSTFWDPVRLMMAHEPRLNPDHLIPTYAEIDGTSVKMEGHSPRERAVENNLSDFIKNCLHDQHVGITMIGTNDGRPETGLRIATRNGRKVTAFGKAVIDNLRIKNKHGVNPYRCPRPAEGSYTGIRDYLAWYADQLGLPATNFSGYESKTVQDWFKNDKPGTIMAFLSGSQGTDIERESFTYRLSDGLSHFDADPKTLRTARPANLNHWAIIVSQGAIPGNHKHQRKMIRKLAARGAIVCEALGDHLCVHNYNRIKDRLFSFMKGRGGEPVFESDSVSFRNFPIHASGHGRRGDLVLWLEKIKAKQFGIHHTDDMESVHRAYKTIEESGKTHPGRIFENGEEIEIGLDKVEPIGRTHTSVILINEIREEGKHHDPRMQAARFFNHDDRSPYHDLGLGGRTSGAHQVSFGIEDERDLRKEWIKSIQSKKRQSAGDLEPKERRPFKTPPIFESEWDPRKFDQLLMKAA